VSVGGSRGNKGGGYSGSSSVSPTTLGANSGGGQTKWGTDLAKKKMMVREKEGLGKPRHGHRGGPSGSKGRKEAE